jgi:hypothetical protein
MSWFQRTIVDLFNAIAAWYYRRKYGAAARQLGRRTQTETGRRGFVIIEIDGLAYDYLRQAVKLGHMPYLARLLLGRELRLARWRCGLPSTTPASQAGIMYGNNWDIPGFRWYDKLSKNSIMCKLPGTVREIQERIARGRAGLLRGGSSYTNMFDGDARLALFTLSAVGRHRVFENVRGLGFLILFGLSPARVAKVIVLSLWTWLVYVVKRTAAMMAPTKPHFTFWGPVNEIFNNVVFREVTTFSTMVDIYRGMPAIYASYTGYDEIAHHFGASSREAFRALRGVDKQIRQIDRIRQLYGEREYDLYILSDHGMTPSLPFSRAYGQTLQQAIAEYTGLDLEDVHEWHESEEQPEARIHFMLDEIRGFEARPRRPLTAQLLRTARELLENRLQAEALIAEWDLSSREDVVVRSSGSLSHVYFNVTDRPMDLSEVTLLYPRLVGALTEHEGVALVVGREGDQVVIAGRPGTLWLSPEGARLEGQSPLAGLDGPEWVQDQVARLAHFPHAGDLILLGAWDRNRVICFEEQIASHGGLGGPQVWPFLAHSSRERLSARGIDRAEQIYTRMVRAYGSYDS